MSEHSKITASHRCRAAVVYVRQSTLAQLESQRPRTIPVSAGLVHLYGDYLHAEYGELDSDYMFVNLFAEPRGQALSYPAVYDLVVRLRKRTGIDFDPHWFRHGLATRMLRDGVPVEVVSKLLGHASMTTTLSVYGHPDRRGCPQGA